MASCLSRRTAIHYPSVLMAKKLTLFRFCSSKEKCCKPVTPDGHIPMAGLLGLWQFQDIGARLGKRFERRSAHDGDDVRERCLPTVSSLRQPTLVWHARAPSCCGIASWPTQSSLRANTSGPSSFVEVLVEPQPRCRAPEQARERGL